MGYQTDFFGRFNLNQPLEPRMKIYLELFNESRRMGRNVDSAFGVEGEFYVFGKDSWNPEPNVINSNKPPKTQPGLWCQWRPTEDGTGIEWDGGEKFYNYTEWLVYIINKILAPNGYVLNGKVKYNGESRGDYGTISVKGNIVFLNGKEVKPNKSIAPDLVLIFTDLEKLSNSNGDSYLPVKA